MRLLLHVGHAKTGTSSIQSSLAAARVALLEAGVLYPKSPTFLPESTNHNSLASGFGTEDRVLRGLKNKIARSELQLDDIFRRYCDEILDQIKYHSPKTVILSGEALFKNVSAEYSKPFLEFIGKIDNEAHVAVYTRRPSDYYISSMQQKLKASHSILTPRPLRIRERVESFQSVFGSNVSVKLYDKSTLRNQDVVSDFIHSYLSDIPNIDLIAPTIRSNDGISAEGMVVLQSFRRFNFPNSDSSFNRPTGWLVKEIQKFSILNGARRRAELKLDIKNFIDESSVDLLWLQKEFGIVVPDIDYSRISPQRRGPPIDNLRVGDIFQVSDLELDRLHTALLSSAMGLTETPNKSRVGKNRDRRRHLRG